MVEQKKDSIELTPKQIGIILAVILAVSGGVPTGLNKFVPDARNKPFTSDDGDELKILIVQLKEFDQILAERIKVLELTQNKIKEDDAECEERVETLTDLVNQHRHEAPPRWVIERLNHIEQELHRLDGRK